MKNNQNEKPMLLEHGFFSLIMSENDLRDLGVDDVAYIKRYTVSGKTAYVLHAADGSAIDVQNNENTAVKNAYYQDLNIVAVN